MELAPGFESAHPSQSNQIGVRSDFAHRSSFILSSNGNPREDEDEFGDFESVPAHGSTAGKVDVASGFAELRVSSVPSRQVDDFSSFSCRVSQSVTTQLQGGDDNSNDFEDEWGDFVQITGTKKDNSGSYEFGPFDANKSLRVEGSNEVFVSPEYGDNGVFDPFGFCNSESKNSDKGEAELTPEKSLGTNNFDNGTTESKPNSPLPSCVVPDKQSNEVTSFRDARKPLPLSLFGDEELDKEADVEDNKTLDLFSNLEKQKKSSDNNHDLVPNSNIQLNDLKSSDNNHDLVPNSNIQLNDLIASLYYQAQKNASVSLSKDNANAENDGFQLSSAPGKRVDPLTELKDNGDRLNIPEVGNDFKKSNIDLLETDEDNSDWEFQDARNEYVVDGNNSVSNPSRDLEDDPSNKENGIQNELLKIEDEDEDDDDWEFKDAVSELQASGRRDSMHDHPSRSAYLLEASVGNLNKLLDFYSKLKSESIFLSLMHLKNLEDYLASATESTNIKETSKEIQEARKKLNGVNLDKQQLRNSTTEEMLGFLQNQELHAFESAYKLSRHISSASQDLKGALDLYTHSLVMTILISTPEEQQISYLSVWEAITSICATELENGLKIWNQALMLNVQMHILQHSKGNKFYAALMEIFKVSQILRVTTELCKPWMFLNPEKAQCITLNLARCTAAWVDSGLKDSVSSSIQTIDIKNEGFIAHELYSVDNMLLFSFLCNATEESEPFCRISLLPASISPGLKVTTWMGNCCILYIANLWANCISSDPPQLPSLEFK